MTRALREIPETKEKKVNIAYVDANHGSHDQFTFRMPRKKKQETASCMLNIPGVFPVPLGSFGYPERFCFGISVPGE